MGPLGAMCLYMSCSAGEGILTRECIEDALKIYLSRQGNAVAYVDPIRKLDLDSGFGSSSRTVPYFAGLST